MRMIFLKLSWKETTAIVRLLLSFAYDHWCDVASDDIPYLRSALIKMQVAVRNDE